MNSAAVADAKSVALATTRTGACVTSGVDPGVPTIEPGAPDPSVASVAAPAPVAPAAPVLAWVAGCSRSTSAAERSWIHCEVAGRNSVPVESSTAGPGVAGIRSGAIEVRR